MAYTGSYIGAVVAALFLLTACDRSPGPAQHATEPAKPAVNVEWTKFVDAFVEGYFAANPDFAAGAGRHEFDGRIRDLSAAGIGKEIARLEQARTHAASFGDDVMSPEERFQREYVLSQIDVDLFALREARLPFTNPTWYFYSGLDPDTYVNVPYAPVDQRARAFIAYAQQIPAVAGQIRTNMETPLPRTFIDFAAAGFSGLAQFYRTDVPQAFADASDQQLQKDLRGAIEPAATALEDLARWFESQRAQASDKYALGAERFAQMLQMTERVDTPLERIETIGRADLERNLAALADVCKRLTGAAPVKACIDKVNADKPEGGAVAGAVSQLGVLRQFVIDKEVVTIPGPEEALVKEAPPYQRQNFAFINIPGPYEQELPSVYYIAPPDPKWSRAEQAAYVPGEAILLFTSAHEVWPGHFLQSLHSNRSSWKFGQLFVGYAYAEGWAHYAEELMVEKGLAQDDPARQVGQLTNALLRNVRYLCAIGLHTKGMTVAECERMFREQAYQDPGNARQQAARGTYDPGYLNYTMGKLMIRKLRADWSAPRGGEQAWKQFNDELLSYGGPPLPLLRVRMMKAEGGELF